MHELAICKSILEVINEQARDRSFRKVNRICVEVGPFSGVEVAALKFGFDVVARNSPADGALLDVRRTPGIARCRSCDRDVEIGRRYDPCPVCGGLSLHVTAGDELRITELEVN